MLFEVFPVIVGFLGSLHCLGMCGPLVLAYSLNIDKSRNPSRARASSESPTVSAPAAGFVWRYGLVHHATFHLGRLLTYGGLGAVAAGLFQAAELSRLFFNIREKTTLLGGVLLILAGLALLKILPLPSCLSGLFSAQGSFIGRRLPALLRSESPVSKFALGMALGFMPCCLSWAMIVTAATTRNPLHGFLTMIGFGIGTLPALLFLGFSASFLSIKVRFLGERAAALSVVAMGLILVLEGAGIIA